AFKRPRRGAVRRIQAKRPRPRSRHERARRLYRNEEYLHLRGVIAMTLKQLTEKIQRGEIDTVVVVFPDVFGRLVGKRFAGEFFLKSVAKHGTHGCNYLLTVNIEMDPMDGFKLANWEKGFGDFEFRPDFSTLRAIPWQPGAALVLCDLHPHDGRHVEEAPRTVLRKQVERLPRAKTGRQNSTARE